MMAMSHADTKSTISDLYGIGVQPSLPCPLALFKSIMSINEIRHRIASSPWQMMSTARMTVLHEINSFEPMAWAESHEARHIREWHLIGQVFQSAVAVYCIASLPVMMEVPEVDEQRTDHRARLWMLLGSAMESPVASRGMVWPLVVAGVEAAGGTAAQRSFVGQQLFQMTCSTGASYPLVAKGVLDRYWASGKRSWDECFDRPYAILT
jgi:hypothetical protein